MKLQCKRIKYHLPLPHTVNNCDCAFLKKKIDCVIALTRSTIVAVPHSLTQSTIMAVSTVNNCGCVIALTHSTTVAMGFSFRVIWENVVKKERSCLKRSSEFQVIFLRNSIFTLNSSP